MGFFVWFASMGEPSWYILTRCILLGCAMLASSLVVLVWAGSPTAGNLLLRDCAGYLVSMALVVMAAGVAGSALMEDILKKRGHP